MTPARQGPPSVVAVVGAGVDGWRRVPEPSGAEPRRAGVRPLEDAEAVTSAGRPGAFYDARRLLGLGARAVTPGEAGTADDRVRTGRSDEPLDASSARRNASLYPDRGSSPAPLPPRRPNFGQRTRCSPAAGSPSPARPAPAGRALPRGGTPVADILTPESGAPPADAHLRHGGGPVRLAVALAVPVGGLTGRRQAMPVTRQAMRKALRAERFCDSRLYSTEWERHHR